MSKKEIERLIAEGYSREQMAKTFGVSISTLKRRLHKLGIVKKSEPLETCEKVKAIDPEEEIEPPIEWQFTILERAFQVLGSRVSEDYRGYLLDGRPINSDDLIREAGLPYPGDLG